MRPPPGGRTFAGRAPVGARALKEAAVLHRMFRPSFGVTVPISPLGLDAAAALLSSARRRGWFAIVIDPDSPPELLDYLGVGAEPVLRGAALGAAVGTAVARAAPALFGAGPAAAVIGALVGAGLGARAAHRALTRQGLRVRAYYTAGGRPEVVLEVVG